VRKGDTVAMVASINAVRRNDESVGGRIPTSRLPYKFQPLLRIRSLGRIWDKTIWEIKALFAFRLASAVERRRALRPSI
jgi:hypothetical protein